MNFLVLIIGSQQKLNHKTQFRTRKHVNRKHTQKDVKKFDGDDIEELIQVSVAVGIPC